MRWVSFGLAAGILFSAPQAVATGERDLVEAVKRGDAAAARTALSRRADVNAAEIDGTTALHWATERDDAELVGLLIRAGASAKAVNRYGVTALSRACTNGNAAIIEMLLKAGADPNAALPDGETPLMNAARTGKVDAMKMLLAHGADVHAREPRDGQTALMWAAGEGNTAAVQTLLEVGADRQQRSKGGFTPLLYAVREGRLETVRALLKGGASPAETVRVNTSPNTEQFRIARGHRDPSALVLAVGNGHFQLASALLDAGADPNADLAGNGWTALHELTWVRRTGQGENLAPVGSGSMTSLELFEKLVAHGADVNARMTKQAPVRTYFNMLGATPFLLAARFTDTTLMRLLAAKGADPKLSNQDGTTPLIAAAGVGVYSPGEDPGNEREALEAVTFLWELGNDVNAVDRNGDTAMHGAAYMGYNAVAQFLVDKGAKPEIWNRQNDKEWTPLQIARGVYRTGSIRSAPQTVPVIQQLLAKASVADGAPAEPPSVPNDLPAEKAVLATLETLTKAFNNSDLKTLRTVYHRDLSAGQSDGPTLTRDQTIRGLNERLGDQRTTSTFKDSTIRVEGPTAFVRNVVTEEYLEGGVSFTFDVLWVLVKGDGPHGWQVLARQATRRSEN